MLLTCAPAALVSDPRLSGQVVAVVLSVVAVEASQVSAVVLPASVAGRYVRQQECFYTLNFVFDFDSVVVSTGFVYRTGLD